jgi:hypothetical protein
MATGLNACHPGANYLSNTQVQKEKKGAGYRERCNLAYKVVIWMKGVLKVDFALSRALHERV